MSNSETFLRFCPDCYDFRDFLLLIDLLSLWKCKTENLVEKLETSPIASAAVPAKAVACWF